MTMVERFRLYSIVAQVASVPASPAATTHRQSMPLRGFALIFRSLKS
jgi:hypothetical protein